MESPEFSLLSSLRGEFKSEDYVPPHYKEVYRLAIDRLVKDGRDSYQEFLKGERVGGFLSEDELLFITKNAVQLPPQNNTEEVSGPPDNQSSSGTYWPMHSDVVTPDLDLGWPEVMHETLQTNIDLLFHPPRQNNPTIKEVVRKNIQDARQVIAIVMDVFTDVDIFKETVEASIRGVPVYILLDDFSLKSFLTMAENQDVKLQQLRNMRVRTVRGQNYVCRSGATFHGAMQQRFLLVDCHTAIYGSYSFTWSSEKLNLNMVQVITGHLVKSYDEEFRTLYARSTVPAGLSPPEGLFPCNGLSRQQIFPKSCPKIERRDNLRHSLDTVYRKTCERKLGTRYFEERLLEEDNTLEPLIENGFPHFQSAEGMNFLKRHSYAGERQDRHILQVIGPRGSNWNISKDTLTNNYPMDNYLQVPQIYRNQNMRQSYNGNDKQVLSRQQNMSTLENTSKSFMRTWRIESYLKNPDISSGESCDYLDQFEPQDKANSFMQGRMRSSLVFRSTIPEQVEPVHYSSAHWNPAESRPNPNELILKRQSWQILDDTGYGPSRNSYQNAYASLGRAKGEQIRNFDILQDTWNKRHSVADPRSNVYAHEDSGQNYLCARMGAGNNAQNGVYRSNLNEDQRSVSHYDVKSITDTQSPNSHIWQEPPSRTASAAALDSNDKDMTDKFNRSGSKHFLNKSSKKIKSFLNIPDKKEGSVRSVDTISLKSGDSTDTLTAEDEEKTLHGGEQPHQTVTSSSRSSSEHQGNGIEDLKSSKPRFRSEENQNPQSFSIVKPNMHKKPTRVGLDTGSFKDRGADGRLYSRFEPFCALEKKHSLRSTQEKTRSLPKGEAATGHNVMHAARRQHENKLEKFFHRVGNFIHKSK